MANFLHIFNIPVYLNLDCITNLSVQLSFILMTQSPTTHDLK